MGFLAGTLILIFLLNCIFLIFLVVIQTGKNSSMGLMGGSSQSVFGSSSVDVLTKITRGAAISFIVLSLILSFIFAKRDEKLPINQEEPVLNSTENKEEPKKENEAPVPPSPEAPKNEEKPK